MPRMGQTSMFCIDDAQDSQFQSMQFSSKVTRCFDRVTMKDKRFEIATWQELQPLIANLRSEMALADDELIEELVCHNPEILRVLRVGGDGSARMGLLAYLPLNSLGEAAITNGTFDGFKPNTDWICPVGIEPVSIYIWLVYLPQKFARSMRAIASLLDELSPQGCPIFSRSINEQSLRLSMNMGFEDARHHFPSCRNGLLVVFPRQGNTKLQPSSAKQEMKDKPTSVRVVRSMDDMCKVIAVRSATYIAEQVCLYDEEFDGNDFCATHLLGSINNDPAGCIRMRFFGTFAKIERLAVRLEYRTSRLAFVLAKAAIDHCRAKGFTKIYGHARIDLVRFWQRLGFRPRPNRSELSFANIQYKELVLDCDLCEQAISLETDPMVIIRPEGKWDEVGPLEISACENDPIRRSIMSARIKTISGQEILRQRKQT
jgi:predicted GNAT family N-acyltransferase